MLVCVYDLETTGLRKAGLPEPRAMQVAALVGDHTGKVHSSFSVLIKPSTAWVVQQGALATHGITVERCHTHGVPIEVALYLIEEYAKQVEYTVAFNEDYDRPILEFESTAGGRSIPTFLAKPAICIMKSMTDICKIPQTSRRPGVGRWKWPKLEEAYHYIFGRLPNEAHDASADVQSTFEMWRILHTLPLQEFQFHTRKE